jgi:hypothetical protein
MRTNRCVQQREFTAPNPAYGGDPKAKKTLKFPLQCLFGPRGTRIAASDVSLVTAVAGLPKTSATALRALCGKPGAAKKALGALDAENMHARGADVAEALGDGVKGDETESESGSSEEDVAGGGGAAGASRRRRPRASTAPCASKTKYLFKCFTACACLRSDATNAGTTRLHLAMIPPHTLACSAAQPKMTRARRKALSDELGLGLLYMAFDDHAEGLEACAAIEALIEISAIETLRNAFLLPLQGTAVKAEVRCFRSLCPGLLLSFECLHEISAVETPRSAFLLPLQGTAVNAEVRLQVHLLHCSACQLLLLCVCFLHPIMLVRLYASEC